MKTNGMNVDTGQKTWITPRWIIEALGPFDLDPCCPDEGMPWPTARKMVRKSEDGLSVDWAEDRVWLNPPYGRESKPFLERTSRSRSFCRTASPPLLPLARFA